MEINFCENYDCEQQKVGLNRWRKRPKSRHQGTGKRALFKKSNFGCYVQSKLQSLKFDFRFVTARSKTDRGQITVMWSVWRLGAF